MLAMVSVRVATVLRTLVFIVTFGIFFYATGNPVLIALEGRVHAAGIRAARILGALVVVVAKRIVGSAGTARSRVAGIFGAVQPVGAVERLAGLAPLPRVACLLPGAYIGIVASSVVREVEHRILLFVARVSGTVEPVVNHRRLARQAAPDKIAGFHTVAEQRIIAQRLVGFVQALTAGPAAIDRAIHTVIADRFAGRHTSPILAARSLTAEFGRQFTRRVVGFHSKLAPRLSRTTVICALVSIVALYEAARASHGRAVIHRGTRVVLGTGIVVVALNALFLPLDHARVSTLLGCLVARNQRALFRRGALVVGPRHTGSVSVALIRVGARVAVTAGKGLRVELLQRALARFRVADEEHAVVLSEVFALNGRAGHTLSLQALVIERAEAAVTFDIVWFGQRLVGASNCRVAAVYRTRVFVRAIDIFGSDASAFSVALILLGARVFVIAGFALQRRVDALASDTTDVLGARILVFTVRVLAALGFDCFVGLRNFVGCGYVRLNIFCPGVHFGLKEVLGGAAFTA